MSGKGLVYDYLNTASFGLINDDQEQEAKRRQQEADRLAKENADKLEGQRKALEAQKKAEELALNAKKKRMAQASSGGSGLLNFNPESGSSILG